jgi:SPP1 gp7 family putative phage head morphogenesis protein
MREFDRVVAGADAARAVLGGLGVPVGKALNLSTAAGFDRAVAELASRLRRRAEPREVDAVRAAVAGLDVDWRRTGAEQRRRLIQGALVAAGRRTALVARDLRAPLDGAAREVVAAARSHARRVERLAIAADFSALDRRVIEHVVRSHGNFVRDSYGRRLEAFGLRARQIVAEGLAGALARDDIAAELARAARGALIDQAGFYWETVAGSFIGRGRSFGQLSSYAEAGIDRYQIVAVKDERTTDTCWFLDGKVFSVGAGLDRFAAVEEGEPERVKDLTPWVRVRRQEGAQRLFVEVPTGRRDVAVIERSAVGQRERAGGYRALVSDAGLEQLGLGFPPYHAHCRSSTVALAP